MDTGNLKPVVAQASSDPTPWDVETVRREATALVDELAAAGTLAVPLKRALYQLEQSAFFRELLARWPALEPAHRHSAWQLLVESLDRIVQDLTPVCVQCGECCRKGSPTLYAEDLEILRQGKISWNQLFTLRRGEAVRSPVKDGPFFLPEERIKVREKLGSQECVLLDSDTNRCLIYADRPLQCRAQSCWDSASARQLEELPYMSRLDLLGEVELLVQLMDEHDRRCSFERLQQGFARLAANRGETIQEVIEMMAYEDHFRHFFAREFNIPEDTLDLVFGRSFADLAPLFGFRVTTDADGTRCLAPDQGDADR
ncbi:MAG: YkgJ family cysteine cluster protein [Rubrivivax sp.]|nr:YkgJ family cysteine cluster protein [Rubrivivax sp.]